MHSDAKSNNSKQSRSHQKNKSNKIISSFFLLLLLPKPNPTSELEIIIIVTSNYQRNILNLLLLTHFLRVCQRDDEMAKCVTYKIVSTKKLKIEIYNQTKKLELSRGSLRGSKWEGGGKKHIYIVKAIYETEPSPLSPPLEKLLKKKGRKKRFKLIFAEFLWK